MWACYNPIVFVNYVPLYENICFFNHFLPLNIEMFYVWLPKRIYHCFSIYRFLNGISNINFDNLTPKCKYILKLDEKILFLLRNAFILWEIDPVVCFFFFFNSASEEQIDEKRETLANLNWEMKRAFLSMKISSSCQLAECLLCGFTKAKNYTFMKFSSLTALVNLKDNPLF